MPFSICPSTVNYGGEKNVVHPNYQEKYILKVLNSTVHVQGGPVWLADGLVRAFLGA